MAARVDRRSVMRRGRAALGCAAAAAAVAWLTAFPARAQDLDSVVAGAKREGAIEVWMATPAGSHVHRALFDAFQRRFGVKTSWKWVALHPLRSIGRLAAEAAVGRVSADIIGATSADNLAQLAEQKLLRPYPWVEVFGAALPGVRESAERLMPELRGTGLAWFDAAYGIAWNTRFVKAEDAPRRFRDLLDPKWKGRFVLNVLGGAPLDLLTLALGEAEALALARGLLANRPVLKGGTPTVGSAITSGEAHLGISAFLNVERARRAGEPQAFRFAEDFVPVMALHIMVPEGAPHPNTARLFAAWLVSEGARIVERMDALSRMTDPDSALAKALAALPPTTRVVQERSLDDLKATRAAARQIEALFTGRR